jgi:hypothetical protein
MDYSAANQQSPPFDQQQATGSVSRENGRTGAEPRAANLLELDFSSPMHHPSADAHQQLEQVSLKFLAFDYYCCC